MDNRNHRLSSIVRHLAITRRVYHYSGIISTAMLITRGEILYEAKDQGRFVMLIDSELINRDPEIMSGTPVFMGTRVPVQNLFDYLEEGHPLEDFLDDFPSVTHEQAIRVLEIVKEALLGQPHENTA